MYSNYNFKGLSLSEEQSNCLELFSNMDYNETLGIQAGAGASKTFTSTAIASLVMPNCRGLYLAYNSAIVEEVKKQFPRYVDVTTTHGIAYKYVGKHYKDRLVGRLTIKVYLKVAKPVNAQGLITPQAFAASVMKTINTYCLSQDMSISEKHVILPKSNDRKEDATAFLSEKVSIAANELWKELINPNGTLPITHDVYLKLFVLKMAQNKLSLPYEYVMLDEAQDTAPIAQQLMHLLLNSKKVAVGDKFQSIYEWRGADNAMAHLNFSKEGQLTTCYRFGQSIADLANNVLNHHLNAGVAFKGNPNKESQIITETIHSKATPNRLVLCRTNAMLFSEMMKSLKRGEKPYLLKDPNALFTTLKGIEQLKAGRTPTESAELTNFSSWAELKEHANSQIGSDYLPLIKAIDEYGISSLTKSVESVTNQVKGQADIVLSTAHASKGAEANHVVLASDFDYYMNGCDVEDSEVNLLYVALTRAKETLDVAQCSALKRLMANKAQPKIVNNINAEQVMPQTTKRNPALERLNLLLS
uniref:ATP-dependent DNA helicase Rep n=1 Tax=Aliivibrio wodanis TaxID=80852 RepID=A0A5Q4ZYH0_9GAMM|nr:UvrD-helicase domain-containing protein [Aliivibrio wodanis]VVV06917.1 ATP-dependent DNA helicase Rep [Aliivibrio wodanis]